MKSLLPFLVVLFGCVGCANPPAKCSPGTASYKLCDEEDNKVYECPQATAEQLADKKAIEDACKAKPDPTQCLLQAEFKMVETTLVADCGAAGEICGSDLDGGVKSASCRAR